MRQQEVIILFCEGETEINLFGFLKLQYSNKKIKFKKPIDLGGFMDFKAFKGKYDKRIKEQDFKPAKDYKMISFLFIIDNDLADSRRIREFLERQGHLVQLCDPNPEGMILAIIGKPQSKFVGDKDYRTKCKNEFKKYFGCEAHKLKELKMKEIFKSEEVLKSRLPTLHKLFSRK